MLALFGVACSIIGLAAIAGLVRSGDTAAASMLALAFAGVFALPLLLLGQLFIVIAVWTAANSLRVEVTSGGLKVVRNLFGYPSRAARWRATTSQRSTAGWRRAMSAPSVLRATIVSSLARAIPRARC